MEKIKFGFGVVKSGQRNVSFEPEFSVLSSPGMFKITPQVSKALGVANGEYVMFINNRDAIDAAIREKDEVVVAFCEEHGLDLEEPATLVAIHKEFDRWAIAKGVKMLTEKGLAQKASERLSKKQKEEYIAADFDNYLEQALAGNDEQLRDALTADGITKDQQIEILATLVTPAEVDKYMGSKCSNSSDMIGAGVVLTFTDSNVWNDMKSDLDKEARKNVVRTYAINLDEIGTTEIFNGYENVKVAYLPLPTEYKDSAPIERKKKEVAE